MRAIAWTAALVLLSTLAVSQSQSADSEHQIVTAAEQKFGPVPNVPECAKAAAVRGDPGTGPSTIFVKMAGACAFPSHWHTPVEQVLMASGSARLQAKGEAARRMTTGAYAYLPSKHVHSFSCAAACSFFVVSDAKFDIHYVDDAGNEIPLDQALAKHKSVKKPASAPDSTPK